MSDKIDDLLARAVYPHVYGTTDGRLRAEMKRRVKRVRSVIEAAGYRIEQDPNFLLEKGAEAGVKIHD